MGLPPDNPLLGHAGAGVGVHDLTLLDAFRVHGDHQALADLFVRHQTGLCAVARRLTDDAADAEDAIQQAFLHLVSVRAGMAEVRHPRAWLVGAVAHVCLRHRRRQARHRRRILGGSESFAHAIPAADPPLGSDDDMAILVRAALDSLPSSYRVPLTMRYLDGLAMEDIASALGRHEGTLRKQISRGLAALRNHASLRRLAVTGSVLMATLGGLQSAEPVPPHLADTLHALARQPAAPSPGPMGPRLPWPPQLPTWAGLAAALACVVVVVIAGMMFWRGSTTEPDDGLIFYPHCRAVYDRGQTMLRDEPPVIAAAATKDGSERLMRAIRHFGHSFEPIVIGGRQAVRVTFAGSGAQPVGDDPRSLTSAHGLLEITFWLNPAEPRALTDYIHGDKVPVALLPAGLRSGQAPTAPPQMSVDQHSGWTTLYMEMLEVGQWRGRPVYETRFGMRGGAWHRCAFFVGRPASAGIQAMGGTRLDLADLRLVDL